MKVNRKPYMATVHESGMRKLKHEPTEGNEGEGQGANVLPVKDTHVRDLSDSGMNAWMGNEPPMTKGEVLLDTIGSAAKIFSSIVSGIIHLPIYIAAAVINKIAGLG